MIERGRYVVRDLGSCTYCHGDPKQYARAEVGEEIPLSGGFVFDIPPGKFYPVNITPDVETGIGRLSDGQVARAHLGGAHLTDDRNPKRTWAAPNITSEPTTGRLAKFTKDEFVARMRAGRAFPGSPMPWQGFQKLHEDDLRAMYRYLKTVPPTVNEVGPPFEDKP